MKKKDNNSDTDDNDTEIPWQNSEAKRLLTKDILAERVSLENNNNLISYKQIYTECLEYSEYSFKKFAQRFYDLHNQFSRETDQAATYI